MTGRQQRQDQTVPWPSIDSHEPDSSESNAEVNVDDVNLSTWQLVCLSISMLGVQVAWTLELAYGTPYLLNLGVSDQITSLVWLAGPLSGLVAQPLAGAISDASNSRYRRRIWIVGSTVIVVSSALLLAFSSSVSKSIILLFNSQVLDENKIRRVEIILAIFAFYLFDFAINGAQASLRNLLLDVTPQEQLTLANAWQARMLHAGSILGNGLGFCDLSKFPILKHAGGDQFRKFCLLASMILSITIFVTCVTQDEKSRRSVALDGRSNRNILQVISSIGDAITQLPRPIKRVCYVQLFSWIGWFPFLFYATAYIGQVMALELKMDPDNDTVTRTGEFALFVYSVVAVASGTIVPYFASRDRRLLQHYDQEPDEEIRRCQEIVWGWQEEASKLSKKIRLPRMPFMLRNIWTFSLALFTVLMLSTFIIRDVVSASAMIMLCGFCWAIACWVPFAIIMEYLKEIDVEVDDRFKVRARVARSLSTPSLRARHRKLDHTEREPLLRRRSFDAGGDSVSPADDLTQLDKSLPGGTVLGIHNLSIVIPQFIVSVISSFIFKIANKHSNPGNIYLGKTGVSWALRFGGVCALIACLLSRRVPPTKMERQMRRRLAYMRASSRVA